MQIQFIGSILRMHGKLTRLKLFLVLATSWLFVIFTKALRLCARRGLRILFEAADAPRKLSILN